MRPALPAPLRMLAYLLLAYLLAPLLALAWPLRDADWSALAQPTLWHATLVSLASASVTTGLIALGGVPLAYWLAQRRGRGGRLLGLLVQLPLALPPLSSGVLLLFLLGPYSPFGRLFTGIGIEFTDSFLGIVAAQTFVAAPFLIVAARSAFATADPELAAVAATLGHGRWARLRKIALPAAWPAILAGLLLSWLRAFGEFGATMMLAYHPYSLPVYTFVAFGSQGLAAMLPLLLPTLACALGVVLLTPWLLRPRRAARPLAPGSDEAPPAPAPLSEPPPGADWRFVFRRRLPGFTLDISIRVHSRRLAILGASGAGKSMLLRLLAGVETAEHASLQLDDRELGALDPADRAIAYVPQRYGLPPFLPVWRHYLFGVGADPAVARRWSVRLGLRGLEQRYPDELSIGQQQRVALVRALARPARLILLDEPFAALDTPLRQQLRLALRQLQREVPAYWALVTHDPLDAQLLADEVVVLDHGQVLQQGATAELFARPNSETVARLLGQTQVFAARRQADGYLRVGDATSAIAAPDVRYGDWLLRIRPAAVRPSAEGVYTAVLEDRHRLGDAGCAYLRWHGLLIEARPDAAWPALGQTCRFDLAIAPDDLWPA